MDEKPSPIDDETALLVRVAEQLVVESVIQVATDRGRTVEVWTIEADGVWLQASAPRLEVAECMQLECRLVMDGETWRVAAIVDEAVVQSPTRARLEIRLVAAEADRLARRGERVPVAVRATLVALVCDRIVPDEAIITVIDDVSYGGFMATVSDTRVRVNDRLRLAGRLIDGVIDCEVRVKWNAQTGHPNERRIGCEFIKPSAESRGTINRLRCRFSTQRAA
jgi:PilZ domain